MRWFLGGLGVATGGYGAWLLLTRQSGEQVVSAGQWLVAGVVLHDVVLSAVVLLAAVALGRLVPPSLRAPVAVVAVVLGSVTLLAVPVLGGFGRRPDNSTLLDRDYTTGWLLVAAVLLVTVAVARLLAAGVARRGGRGLRAGR